MVQTDWDPVPIDTPGSPVKHFTAQATQQKLFKICSAFAKRTAFGRSMLPRRLSDSDRGIPGRKSARITLALFDVVEKRNRRKGLYGGLENPYASIIRALS